MRLFIAVPLPQEFKQKIEEVLRSLRGELGTKMGAGTKVPVPIFAKWVRPENLHLTLKFLGETSENRIPLIKGALARALLGESAFDISFQGIGFFPSSNFAKVMWVGIEDCGNLMTLAKKVEEETVRAGAAAEEREFSAHLTLARFPSPLKQEGKNIEDQFKALNLGALSVDKVQLIQSVLSPKGPTYYVLEEFPFSNG